MNNYHTSLTGHRHTVNIVLTREEFREWVVNILVKEKQNKNRFVMSLLTLANFPGAIFDTEILRHTLHGIIEFIDTTYDNAWNGQATLSAEDVPASVLLNLAGALRIEGSHDLFNNPLKTRGAEEDPDLLASKRRFLRACADGLIKTRNQQEKDSVASGFVTRSRRDPDFSKTAFGKSVLGHLKPESGSRSFIGASDDFYRIVCEMLGIPPVGMDEYGPEFLIRLVSTKNPPKAVEDLKVRLGGISGMEVTKPSATAVDEFEKALHCVFTEYSGFLVKS